MKKMTLTVTALTVIGVAAIAGSFAASAAEYESNRAYTAGAVVEFEGKTYRAKWYVNVGQSPAAVASAANAWETPWELVQQDGSGAAPVVSVQAPTDGAAVVRGSAVHIRSSVMDKDGRVVRVEAYVNDVKVGASTTAPFTITWTPETTGDMRIQLRATDDQGLVGSSSVMSVKVVGEEDGSQAPGDTYDINASYAAGCVVTYKGVAYKAKWYANPGQSPAALSSAENPWDSPWELSPGATPGCADTNPGDGGDGGDPGPQPLPPVDLTLSQLLKDEQRLTADPMMLAVKASIRTLPNEEVEKVTPLRRANPDNVRRVEAIVPEDTFEHFFPKRAPEYTYRGLLQAFAKFPAICATYEQQDSDAICRKTLATMFAHFAQETGGHEAWWEVPEWRQALVHVREMGWDEQMRGGYNGECQPGTWQAEAWPCGRFADGAFKSYFGRGAKQLSYNYNYGPFSEAMFGTVRTLLDDPALVADTWLNLASATFFFSYPQPPKPSMLHVIDGTWVPNQHDIQSGLVPGFGVTTQIINGGVECGGSAEHAQSANRISYYRSFADALLVPIPGNEVLGCKTMKQFDEGGAGAVPIYWEQDYSWNPGNEGGASYACKLVGYQTPFSALKEGDYVSCVAKHFPNATIIDDLK